jgi:hypothetical protein
MGVSQLNCSAFSIVSELTGKQQKAYDQSMYHSSLLGKKDGPVWRFEDDLFTRPTFE